MRKKEVLISLAVMAVGLLVSGLIIYRPWNKNQAAGPGNNDLNVKLSVLGKKLEKVSIPNDPLFQIVQASETRPKFLQARIDPPDVHVGDIQKFEVILEDEEQIVSVEARIQTDHDMKIVKLKPAGAASAQELKPVSYYVNEKHQLAFVSDGVPKNIAVKEGVAYADTTKIKYQGEWKVYDTHDTTYKTTFVAKDIKGRESSFALAWSDYCSIPNGGNWTMSITGNQQTDCYLSAMDGVDSGSATISNYTLRIQPPGKFVFNPGQSITLNGGTIVIQDGAQIQKGYLWVYDGDGDNWISNNQVYSGSDPNNHP